MIRLRWKIAGLALFLAAASFGSSIIFDDGVGQVVLYAFVPLLLLLAIFFAALIARVRVFGRLRADIDSRLSPAFLRPARLWAIFKVGILGAVAILGVGSIISGIAGAGIRHGVEGIVYLTLIMMFGNLAMGSILNVEIAKLGHSSNRQT